MQTKPVPRKIEPFNPKQLFMSWSDGSEYSIPYLELRFQCPCAGCVDEHTGKRMLRKESIHPEVRPTEVHPIGRYAIQFNWSDGHATGMYHYERLLELCQAVGEQLKASTH